MKTCCESPGRWACLTPWSPRSIRTPPMWVACGQRRRSPSGYGRRSRSEGHERLGEENLLAGRMYSHRRQPVGDQVRSWLCQRTCATSMVPGVRLSAPSTPHIAQL
jgi:hypothetical protein